MMIKCWADEYDSDMEEEWNNNCIRKLEKTKNEEIFYKFSNKICEKKSLFDFNLFTTVENSEYSCLMPWYLSQVNKSLSEMYNLKNNYKIIDAGANIGVDCINFLYNFPKSQLIAFEIDNKTYKALCKNLLQFYSITKVNSLEQLTDSSNKIQAYNKDFLFNLEVIKNADIVFIDAPWGGKIYKDKNNISIYLQSENDYYKINKNNESKNIINITKKILNEYNVKSVILKVPYNYEFSKLENEIFNLNKNIKIVYKNIYKGNSTYIAFILVFIFI